MKNYLMHLTLPCLLLIGSLSMSTYALTPKAEAVAIESMTFTDTQTWLPRYLQWAETAIDIPSIALPASPKNTSKTTKKDLDTMHGYQDARTEINVEEIKQENSIYNAFFGDKTLGELVDESNRPLTFELMKMVIELESPQIMKQKKLYNRVRPSYLDPTLKPVIDIPDHPAYPSGHSTQAHLRALVLSELDPKNRARYEQAAKRIARNREIAGLHYPSDSKAGAILAKQLFKKLMSTPDFSKRLEAAKAEWQSK